MTAKKRRPGRPELGTNARTIAVSVKLSEREIKAIEKAARLEGSGVSSWIRDQALRKLVAIDQN